MSSSGMPAVNSATDPSPNHELTAGQLKGNLGIGGIVFSVVAFAAPLLVVVGLMPSVIGFAGQGIVLAFTAVTFIVLLFSVGYATLTRYVERPGAFYAYITAGLGRSGGLGGAFVAVSGYLMLLLSTWIAFGVYARRLIADTLHGPDLPWFIYGIAGALLAGWFSFRRIEFSAKALGVALLLEAALVIVFDTVVFLDGGPAGGSHRPLSLDAIASGNFGLALLFGALCFIGFESAALYREEAKNPEKTIPRATYLSVILIGVFYIIAAWALLVALGPEGVATAGQGDVTTMFGDLSVAYLGAIVPDLINVLVITSTFACLLASRNAVARYGYSLGRDGVFPSKLGVAHPKYHSPYVASLSVTALEVVTLIGIAAATGFELVGDNAFTVYVRVNGLGAIAVVFLMCLVSLAVIAYFIKNRVRVTGRVWKTAIAPTLGLLGLVAILILGLVNVDTLIGAGPLASGLLTLLLPIVFIVGIIYARFLRRQKPHVYTKIGRQ